MTAPILDVTVIESAAEARLVQMIPAIRKTAVQKDGRFLFNNPALAVSIYESGEWVKKSNRTYLVPCSLHVLLTVSNAKSEEARRADANPLVFAIAVALTHQTLGLSLEDPGLEPKRFADVTDDEDWKNNKIVYLIEFSLRFAFNVPQGDEDAHDLIGVATDYLLEPGNLLAAQDEMTT